MPGNYSTSANRGREDDRGFISVSYTHLDVYKRQELSQPLETAGMGRWFACGWYRGAARQSILAWKDHGDEECDRPFSDALCRLAERAGVIDAMDGVREICDTILVVPAPSSIASMRQRGRRHMLSLIHI